MSQPLGNVSSNVSVYPCGKKKQYLCVQTISATGFTSTTAGAGNMYLPLPTTILPVSVKLNFSGHATLSSAVPVMVFIQAYTMTGQAYDIFVNWQLLNNGTTINIPEQEVILPPYTFTSLQNSGLVIQSTATVTITAAINSYVEVVEE
ncbi:hypothetical protein [Thermofilum sp.]|uniref:hypothetical protein n=1 Tax=Thermofilum sp. TaxID=1961369 RepID=UPI003181884E